MSLREQAKGQPCQIRSEVCNHDPATTALCHIHKPSISGGMALKANDLLAAHGCNSCHDWVDGRGNTVPRQDRDIVFYEGVLEPKIYCWMKK